MELRKTRLAVFPFLYWNLFIATCKTKMRKRENGEICLTGSVENGTKLQYLMFGHVCMGRHRLAMI